VKVNNILTMMGSGVLLAFTGGMLLVTSAALGLAAAFPALPTWAAFLIIGVAAAGIGGFLLSRSGAETSKKIEKVERKFTLHEAWRKKPWLMLGASVAAGFVAQRILRGLFSSGTPEVTIEPAAIYEHQEEVRKEKKHSSFKDFLMKPFVELARHATTRAIALGAQMVVTPLIMKKLQEVIDQHNLNFTQEQDSHPEPGEDGRNQYSQPQANGNRRF
jgi:hypothetical protein